MKNSNLIMKNSNSTLKTSNLYVIYFFVLIIIFSIVINNSFSNSIYQLDQKLLFIENKGQVIDDENNVRPDILYSINTNKGVKAYLTKKGVMYAWIQVEKESKLENDENAPSKFEQAENTKTNTYQMDMELIGANENPEVIAEGISENYTNYYLAHCPDGITNVKSYTKIIYKNIYKDIDLVFYPNAENKLEYDFAVKPGGNIADIKFQYNGNVTIRITENGSLEINNPLGSITEKTPFTYLQHNKREVASQFQLNNGIVSFKVNNYDKDETIVIDPTLAWGTFFGGDQDEYIRDSYVNSGYVYVTGYTKSTSGISSSGSFQTTYGGSMGDAFIAKFSTDGDFMWATYYGGSKTDYGYSISGYGSYIYLAGSTFSSSAIATTNSYISSNTNNLHYAFLAKFNLDGTRVWGTYYNYLNSNPTLGYENYDYRIKVAMYLSTPYISGSYNISSGTRHAYVCKFNSNGNAILWEKALVGNNYDQATDLCIDNASNAIITGETNSSSGLATSGAYDATYGGDGDVFIAKYDKNGSLKWCTYLGDTESDEDAKIACDGYYNIYVCGRTYSEGLAYKGYISSINNDTSNYYSGSDLFISKFSSTGNLTWLTYYGGTDSEYYPSISVYNNESIYVNASSYGNSDFPITSNAYQQSSVSSSNYSDGELIKFTTSGSLVWSSLFGSSGTDAIYDISISKDNSLTYPSIYIVGNSTGHDNTSFMITKNSYQDECTNCNDDYNREGFISRLDDSPSISYNLKNQTIDELNMVNSIGEETSVSIFPNPSSSIFNIELQANASITVYNMQGSKVIEKNISTTKIQLDLSNFEKGIYVVHVQNELYNTIRKITLQ